MKTKRLFLLIAALLPLLSACNGDKDYVIYTNYMSFGDVLGTIITTDPDGAIFVVTEDQTDGGWKACARVLAVCDVRNRTDDGAYPVTLKSYNPVSILPTLTKSSASVEQYGTDAVYFFEDWGLNPDKQTLNMTAVTTSLKDSDGPHTVSLVFDDLRSNRDTVYYELHHQGFGESYENLEYDEKDFQSDPHYLTFNLAGTIPSGAGSSIILSIEWDWFKTDDDGSLTREVERKQIFGTLFLQ